MSAIRKGTERKKENSTPSIRKLALVDPDLLTGLLRTAQKQPNKALPSSTKRKGRKRRKTQNINNKKKRRMKPNWTHSCREELWPILGWRRSPSWGGNWTRSCHHHTPERTPLRRRRGTGQQNYWQNWQLNVKDSSELGSHCPLPCTLRRKMRRGKMRKRKKMKKTSLPRSPRSYQEV